MNPYTSLCLCESVIGIEGINQAQTGFDCIEVSLDLLRPHYRTTDRCLMKITRSAIRCKSDPTRTSSLSMASVGTIWRAVESIVLALLAETHIQGVQRSTGLPPDDSRHPLPGGAKMLPSERLAKIATMPLWLCTSKSL